MHEIFVPAMHAAAGYCAYAGVSHALIGLHRPIDRTHLLFTVLCLAATLHIVLKAAGYSAASPESLVWMRRWDLTFGALFLAVLPWFVAHYSGLRPRWLLEAICASLLVTIAANHWLLYGAFFAEIPQRTLMTLPWGEQVVDLGAGQRSPWLLPGVAGSVVGLAYGVYAAARQYRAGDRRRAAMLGGALLVFTATLLVNYGVNFGLLASVHTAHFGFIALVLVMNEELNRERRRHRLRLQAIIDGVPAVVYMKDRDGRYLLSNRRYEELLGVEPGSILGRTDRDLFPARRAEAFRASDREVMERGAAMVFEEVAEVKGEPRTYVSHKFPQFDAAGSVDAVCGVSLDVTEARRAEAEMDVLRPRLWHADRVERAGVLAASLAHEISQPLTAILANAQAALRFLDRDAPDMGEVRECLQDIVRDDKRASGVINGLRAMLRRQDVPRERVDLGQCVGEVLCLMRAEFAERGIEVNRVPSDGPMVEVHKPQIQQVLLNLFLNASEAMAGTPAGERLLTVTITGSAATVQVSIADHGCGLAGEQLDRMFDGFYTTKPQGLGIGLAVCRSIVEAHGGSISVARNEGCGLTVSFTLPRGAAGAKPV